MIWVIGDIHGLLEPLKDIFQAIRDFEGQSELVEKVIFLGDFLESAPRSAEALDFIQDLEYETILIVGDQADLAFRSPDQAEKNRKSNGEVWFYNGNPRKGQTKFRNEASDDFPWKYSSGYFFRLPDNGDCQEKFFLDYQGWRFPEKHERSVQDFQDAHQESFEVNGRLINFTFCHHPLLWERTLAEPGLRAAAEVRAPRGRTLRLAGISDSAYFEPEWPFSDYENLGVEDGFVWGRNSGFRYGGLGDVIVSGQASAQIYERCYNDLTRAPRSRPELFPDYRQSLLDLPFLFSRSPWAGYDFEVRRPAAAYLVARPGPRERLGLDLEAECVHYDSGPTDGVAAINLDTGAMAGDCLTAIGLSQKYLSFGLIPVLSSRLNSSFFHKSHNYDNPRFCFIHVTGFGDKKIIPEI
ncbi:MAG: metallophosphoesterase [Deltaproteobacteria bacterium]|jgi:hypothetical protein|nr:metallophosphoesterase [Deltaproteobacteria bacterium]